MSQLLDDQRLSIGISEYLFNCVLLVGKQAQLGISLH